MERELVAENTQTSPVPFKLRANRKVVGGLCGICGRGFALAEDVYACPYCSGHHHTACWEAHKVCNGLGVAPATAPEPPGEDGTEPSQPDTPPALAPDERLCPACSKVIKSDAMKCRFCGNMLDQEFAAQVRAQNMPPELAKQVESSANQSLAIGIVSMFFCAPILGPTAISKGHDAHRLLAQYPAHAANTSAGGKARAGIIIGWAGIILFVIGVLSRCS